MRASVSLSFMVVLGCLMGVPPLATDLYLPAMPSIGQVLGASPEAVAQTISLYLVCFALFQLLFGPLSDAYGRRLITLTGLLLFSAGSFLCAFASDITSLILFRALQGLGAGAIVVTVPALVRDCASGSEFSRIMGFIMMVMGVTPLVAPLLGSAILLFSGWRTIFIIQGAMALLLVPAYVRRVGETLSPERRIPFNPGNLLKNYLVVLGQGPAMLYILCSALAMAALFGFLAASPFVYIEYYGISEQFYGVLFALNVVLMLLLTSLGNRLVGKTGPRRTLGLAMAIVLLSCLLMLLVMALPQPPLALVVVAIMLFIGTAGVINANSTALVMTRLGQVSGSASAVAGTLRFGLGALAPVAVGLLYDGTAFALAAVIAGCGLLAVGCFVLASRADRRAEAAEGVVAL